MGMRIPSGTQNVQSNAQSWQQRSQNMQALTQALSSGNLDAAKSAYAALTGNGSGQTTMDPNSPLGKIGQALQNGDVAGAQKAMSQMKAGHHHRTPSASASTSTTTPTTPTTASSTQNGTNGGTVNVYV